MTDRTLRLKIQLVDPPVGYAFCLQRYKGAKAERLDHIEVVEDEKTSVEFELKVIVRMAKSRPEPDFFGPFTQGASGSRFFYVCVGSVGLDGITRWEGRVKVPLTGIDWSTVDAATTPGKLLIASYQASKPDGRPVYASVKLLDDGWEAQRQDE